MTDTSIEQLYFAVQRGDIGLRGFKKYVQAAIESRVLAERDQEPTLTDADWIRDAVFQAGITSDVWYQIKDAIDAAKGASKMTFDEWCASKGYEPRRNGSLYEAWQAAIESRVLAEGKPFAYTTRADLEMMAKHNTATIYRDPVDGDIALFTRPTPDDASVDTARLDFYEANLESDRARDGTMSVWMERGHGDEYTGPTMRAAIDAAMQADKETK